jgi:phosphoglucomutase
MSIHPLAGQKAPKEFLIDASKLESDYYSKIPDTADPTQLVAFGTSGHRGSPFDATFTEAHILAITQAICDYRKANGISGPVFMGKDTHGVSGPAQRTALEVLAANGVDANIQADDGFTPTPVVSHAILTYNESHPTGQSDGIVITPSHNPPRDGGFKYNPPDGGPADTAVTNWMQDRANALMKNSNKEVRRLPYESALKAATTHRYDFVTPYVIDLANVIDLDSIRAAGIRIGIDPLGGAALHYWQPVAERFRLNITVVNQAVDPTFSFMTLDHDGKIRMDCSSPYAMAGLVKLKDDFDISFGNDPDSDRHGIVTRSAGLLNPNHYLAVAIQYLLGNRPEWPKSAAVGKTLVSSAIIDRVVTDLQRKLWEVPVGFKWFVPGLLTGECCFGGEESAGASFLRRNGKVWTTDKDGPILGLLAAEITARTGKDPGEHYREITTRFGESFYTRIDTPATPEIKEKLKKLTPAAVIADKLAGEPITAKLTKAPGNDAPIGGLKVASAKGWFAARPSGTENIYKLYAESLVSKEHLDSIITEAGKIIAAA